VEPTHAPIFKKSVSAFYIIIRVADGRVFSSNVDQKILKYTKRKAEDIKNSLYLQTGLQYTIVRYIGK
jgi:hypothetical protein